MKDELLRFKRSKAAFSVELLNLIAVKHRQRFLYVCCNILFVANKHLKISVNYYNAQFQTINNQFKHINDLNYEI